ncbi:MAG: hypothetical protein PHI85_04130, partial [Victivallaceae bacterium]|nr:hypothetical protein [Victivallaceae bacterium]
ILGSLAKLHTTVYVIDCQIIKLRKVSRYFSEQLNSIMTAYDNTLHLSCHSPFTALFVHSPLQLEKTSVNAFSLLYPLFLRLQAVK